MLNHVNSHFAFMTLQVTAEQCLKHFYNFSPINYMLTKLHSDDKPYGHNYQPLKQSCDVQY